MLRIAIVDPSDATRAPLRSLLLGIDFVWLEAECARYEYFFDVVKEAKPDLAIVVLNSSTNDALNLITQLSAEHTNLPILSISSDHQALLNSLKYGARYFLTHPVQLEELLNALRKVQGGGGGGTAAGMVGRGGPKSPAQKSQVITIMGVNGGVGCTSIGVNLGTILAADPNNHVALLDLDLALGDADIMLDVPLEQTIADLAMNIDKLDMAFIKRTLVEHTSKLSLLTHPLQMQDIGIIHEEHLQRIINLLKISYSHLILDISKSLLPTDRMALMMSDVILLVGHLDLSSLRNIVRMFLMLGTDDGVADKVRVIVNQVGSENNEGAVSLKRAEETIGRPIFWQIPSDPKPMGSARVSGIPLIQHAPKSKVYQSLVGLSQALSGKPVTPIKVEPEGGFWNNMFGKRK